MENVVEKTKIDGKLYSKREIISMARMCLFLKGKKAKIIRPELKSACAVAKAKGWNKE